MRKIFTLIALFIASVGAITAQNTYTWNVARGDWSVATNWSPSRTSPAANDILVFNGSVVANACATGIPTQTIGKLRIINNANVRFIAANPIQGTGTINKSTTSITGTGTNFTTELKLGDILTNANVTNSTASTSFYGEVASISSNTALVSSASSGLLTGSTFYYAPSLNLNDGTNSALDIAAGSTLTMSDSSLVIRLLAGSKGQVSGLVRMLNARQRLIALDTLGLVITSTGIIRSDSSFTGNAFSIVGGQNTVVFQAGSAYDYIVGSNPFALTAPASKVYFAAGSTYIQSSTSTPSLSGRTMANFKFNVVGNVTATQNATAVFDTLTVQQGQFNINSSGTNTFGTIIVSGGAFSLNQTAGVTNFTNNLNVAAGAKMVLGGKFASTPAAINFRGTNAQSISGAGEIRIAVTADSSVRIRIQNPQGITLQRNLDLNAASLDLDSGFVNLNSNTLTIGTATINGKATQLNGTVRGSGNLTRWYAVGNYGVSDSSLFPMGSANGVFPIWVSGTSTNGGTVTVTGFTDNSTVSNFTTPFSDASQTSGTITVNSRFGHAWTLTSGNGLAGTAFNIRAKVTTNSGFITDVTKMRLTLANGIAPGTVSEDGAGTLTQPTAGKIGVTAAQLSNTFYMGSSTSSNPLDVMFISVAAKTQNRVNEITWKTAQELNLSYFAVERLDGENFIEVGRIVAQNRKVGATYLFVDGNNTCATYRVVGVDVDGKRNYSALVSTDCKVNNQLVVSPNPVVDVFSIGTTDASNVKVFNTLGEQVSVSVQASTIDVSSLKSGVYTLQLTVEGKTQVVKFIKQ